MAITAGSAGSFAVVGAVNDDDHGALSSGSAYVWKKRLPLASSTVWEYVDKLTAGAADAAQEAYFGWSVGISSESGGNAVAGAWGTNGVGAAFIFEYDASTFSLVNKLVANDAAPNDQFGRAVAIDGAEALIGAPNKACSTTGVCGAAYIFEQVQMGGSKMWAEVQKLIPDDAAGGDTFGGSVAISASAGGWAVVGAPGKTGVRLYSGAASDAGV